MAFGERRLKVVGVGGTLREGSASLGALRRALAAAGAETELLDLRDLDLPMYRPGMTLDEYGAGARRLVEELRGRMPSWSARRPTTGRSRASRRTRWTSRSSSPAGSTRTSTGRWSA